jgi:hypothetical protein
MYSGKIAVPPGGGGTVGNKRQTTVTINQILTQKWFLLQNIKDSSYFRNDVFNDEE